MTSAAPKQTPAKPPGLEASIYAPQAPPTQEFVPSSFVSQPVQDNHSNRHLYRFSSLGLALTDTLDDLINEQRIEPQLAMKVLASFDRVVTEVLAERVKARLTFKGHLDTYRFCDEVWTFLIKDVTFKLENSQTFQAEKIKIVSCNSKRPGEA